MGLPQPFTDSQSGRCVVVGTAPGWELELASVTAHGLDADMCMVNDAGMSQDGDWWVTLHPEYYWANGEKGGVHVSDKPYPGEAVDIVVPVSSGMGTSSYLAVCAMLIAGYDQIVTAGVHLSGEYRQAQAQWNKDKSQFLGRLASASPHGTYVTDTFGSIYDG